MPLDLTLEQDFKVNPLKKSWIRILDPDGDPDHPQKLIDWSLAHFGPILKIL